MTGSLEVRPSNSKNVELRAFFDEELTWAKVDFKNGNLRIAEKPVNKNQNRHWKSEWFITVPADIEMEASSGTGSIKIQEFSGELDASSGTGSLELNESKGELEVSSGTSNVTAMNCTGEMELNSGTGSVEVSNCEGKLKLGSGTGSVEIKDSKGRFTANSGTGRVSASSLSIMDESKFSSGTGTARVSLNGPLNADVEITSGTGNAKLEFDQNQFEGNLTMVCGRRASNIQSDFKFDKEWVEENGNNKTYYKSKKFGEKDFEVKVSTGTGRAIAQE